MPARTVAVRRMTRSRTAAAGAAAATTKAEDGEEEVPTTPDVDGGAAAATAPPPPASAGRPGWRRVGAAAVDLARSQWFILCLGAVIGLAALTPEVGRTGGWIRSEYTVAYGCVVLIFFLTGLAVKLTALRHALTAWRLLLLVQVVSFVVLPAVTWGVAQLVSLGGFFDPYVLVGLVLMACVPTTVSSCAVLTKAADGDEVAAVVNSIVGNTLGVFVSPGLVLLLVGGAGGGGGWVDVGTIFLKLGMTVIVPMVLGEIVQALAPNAVQGLRARVNFTVVSQCALLLFVYALFCNTFTEQITLSGPQVAALVALVVALHGTYLGIAWGTMAIPWWRLPRTQRVAGFFVASQKTLSMGAPLVNVIFAGHANVPLAFITLPLLILHPLQLFVAGLLSRPLKRWVHRDQPTGSDTDHHDGDGALLMQTFAADGEAEGEGEGERGTDTTVGEAPHATS